MTTKRLITCEIWEDDFFTALTIFDRLLWIGLISRCADDQGRLQDNAALIRSQAFPLDDIPIEQVEAGLSGFERAGRIVRYKAGGKQAIQVLNWWKHQTPQWAGKSNYPPPEGWTDRVRYHGKGNEIISENWDTGGGYIAGYIAGYVAPYIAPKAGDCIPSLLIRDVNGDVKGDGDADGEVEGEKKPSAAAAAAAAGSPLSGTTGVGERKTGKFISTEEAGRIYTRVTMQICVPSGGYEEILRLIHDVARKIPEPELYLKGFFSQWVQRGYSALNWHWLDWAVGGKVPPPGKGERIKDKGERGGFSPAGSKLERSLAAIDKAGKDEK